MSTLSVRWGAASSTERVQSAVPRLHRQYFLLMMQPLEAYSSKASAILATPEPSLSSVLDPSDRLLKLPPRQSVTSLFVVFIISNMQGATFVAKSGGRKLLLFVKRFNIGCETIKKSLKSNVFRSISSPARSPANS